MSVDPNVKSTSKILKIRWSRTCTSRWINATDAEVSQVSPSLNFLFWYLPFVSLRREALQHSFGKRLISYLVLREIEIERERERRESEIDNKRRVGGE